MKLVVVVNADVVDATTAAAKILNKNFIFLCGFIFV